MLEKLGIKGLKVTHCRRERLSALTKIPLVSVANLHVVGWCKIWHRKKGANGTSTKIPSYKAFPTTRPTSSIFTKDSAKSGIHEAPERHSTTLGIACLEHDRRTDSDKESLEGCKQKAHNPASRLLSIWFPRTL